MSEANMFQTSQDPNNPTDNNQEQQQQQQQQTRFFGAGFPGSPMAQSFQDQSGFMASSPVQSRFMNADRNWLDLPPPQQQMASSWHGGQPGSPGQFQATFMETITYPPNGSFDRFYTYNAAPQNDTRDLNLPSGIELPSNSGPSSPGYGAPPTMFLQHYSTFGTAPRFALNAQTNEAQQQQSGAPAEQSNEQTGNDSRFTSPNLSPNRFPPTSTPNNSVFQENSIDVTFDESMVVFVSPHPFSTGGANQYLNSSGSYPTTPSPSPLFNRSIRFKLYPGDSPQFTAAQGRTQASDPNLTLNGHNSTLITSNNFWEANHFGTNHQNATGPSKHTVYRSHQLDGRKTTKSPEVYTCQAQPYRITPANASLTSPSSHIPCSCCDCHLATPDYYSVIQMSDNQLRPPTDRYVAEHNLPDQTVYFASTDLNATHPIEAVDRSRVVHGNQHSRRASNDSLLSEFTRRATENLIEVVRHHRRG